MVQAKTAIAALTSRRNFIKSGAALAVASVSPALAFPSEGQDAELIELGRQLETINTQWWKSGESVSRLAGVAENQYPPLSDVLKARDTDKPFHLPTPNDGKWYRPTKGGNREEPGYYVTGQLNELKQFKPTRQVEIPIKEYRRDKFGPNDPLAVLYLEDEVLIKVVPWPEAQARVDQLIEAIEVWRKACRKINHTTGYMKAEREFQRLATKHHNILKKILRIEARSMQGILVKVRAVKLIHADDDEIEFGDGTNERLAASILNELLALQA